ncbi:MAG: low molecular weight phosphatase family protein [Actinomycetota bacterium]|nr:low molecular weight phosphatase family protein [Actinomycetota bacterium]
MATREPLRILVVCTGNVCRSPLAERLLQARLGDRVTVRSAGVRGLDAAEMDQLAAAELARRGGDPAGFRSRRLERADVREADLVLTMTTEQRSELLAEEPEALSRTFTLRELENLLDSASVVPLDSAAIADLARQRSAATVERYDIADPIGQSAAVHHAVADEIDEAVAAIVKRLDVS